MTRRSILAGAAAFAVAPFVRASFAAPAPLAAPTEPLSTLKSAMDAVADRFHGTLGYALHHRTRGERIDRRGDEPFPTASTIKTAILCEAMHQVETGVLRWDDNIPVQPGPGRREEGGPAFFFKDDAALRLPEWLDLMITLSDNTATINLRDRLGMANINRWLSDHGFHQTKILNGPDKVSLGLLPLQQQFGLGMTTPLEMARLLELIRDGGAGSPASCDRMLRLLTHQFWDDDAASQIPPWVQIAHKTGAVDASRSEAALVFSPSGEYALTVYTKQQADQRWVRDNEGDVAIRTLSRLVWRHYHPSDPWTPPPGAETLLP